MQQKRGVSALLAFILLVMPVSSVFAQSIEELQEQNEQRQLQMDEAQENIEVKETEKSEVLWEILELDNEIAALDENITVIEGEIEVLDENIAKNKQEIRRLEKRIAENEKLFSERINAMFKSAKGSYMQVLLNSADLSELLSRSQMMKSIADYDKSLIAALKNDHEKLEETKAALEADMQELKEKEAELQSEKERVQIVVEEKGNYVAQLQSQINDEEELVAILNAEFQEAENTIAYLVEEARKAEEARIAEEKRLAEEARIAEEKRIAAEEAARQAAAEEEAEAQRLKDEAVEKENAAKQELESYSPPSYPSVHEGLAWPVPASYNITSYFGGRTHPISGVYHAHNGVDVGAPVGTTLVAAQSGTVILASWNGGYGNCVMINHGNGMVTLYGHMNSFYVGTGQWVEKGQAIGEVGNTGLSTGPHLHFEVIVNGGKVNPMNYLQ